jgi:hypothetical protein
MDVSSGKSSILKFGENFLGKDLVTIIFGILFVGVLISSLVFYFIDADNWVKSNNMITPLHIKPE